LRLPAWERHDKGRIRAVIGAGPREPGSGAPWAGVENKRRILQGMRGETREGRGPKWTQEDGQLVCMANVGERQISRSRTCVRTRVREAGNYGQERKRSGE